MAEVTSANEGFPESCRSIYERLSEEIDRALGPSPTGTPEIGSIANFSREELVTLGAGFSTRPSSLQLDETMDEYWQCVGPSQREYFLNFDGIWLTGVLGKQPRYRDG